MNILSNIYPLKSNNNEQCKAQRPAVHVHVRFSFRFTVAAVESERDGRAVFGPRHFGHSASIQHNEGGRSRFRVEHDGQQAAAVFIDTIRIGDKGGFAGKSTFDGPSFDFAGLDVQFRNVAEQGTAALIRYTVHVLVLAVFVVGRHNANFHLHVRNQLAVRGVAHSRAVFNGLRDVGECESHRHALLKASIRLDVVQAQIAHDLVRAVVVTQIDVDCVVLLKGIHGMEAEKLFVLVGGDHFVGVPRNDHELCGRVRAHAAGVGNAAGPQKLHEVELSRPQIDDDVVFREGKAVDEIRVLLERGHHVCLAVLSDAEDLVVDLAEKAVARDKVEILARFLVDHAVGA